MWGTPPPRLVANNVMAWKADSIQSVINRISSKGLPTIHLARIAPEAFRHINMHDKLHLNSTIMLG